MDFSILTASLVRGNQLNSNTLCLEVSSRYLQDFFVMVITVGVAAHPVKRPHLHPAGGKRHGNKFLFLRFLHITHH